MDFDTTVIFEEEKNDSIFKAEKRKCLWTRIY